MMSARPSGWSRWTLTICSMLFLRHSGLRHDLYRDAVASNLAQAGQRLGEVKDGLHSGDVLHIRQIHLDQDVRCVQPLDLGFQAPDRDGQLLGQRLPNHALGQIQRGKFRNGEIPGCQLREADAHRCGGQVGDVADALGQTDLKFLLGILGDLGQVDGAQIQLRQGVQSISDLIVVPGLVNLDFADVTAVMKDAGYAHMGIGKATGKDKAQEAARAAFGGGGDLSNLPTVEMAADKLAGEGMGVVNFIKELGLVPSNREGFMTIEQGGLKIDGEKITDKKFAVTPELFKDGKILVEKGKKKKVLVELV